MQYIVELGLLTGGLLVGLVLGYFMKKLLIRDSMSRAEKKAHAIIEDAKDKQKELLLESKNKAIEIMDEAKIDERERRKEMQELQARLEKRETMFDSKILEFEEKQKKLSEQIEKVKA
ncbi:MAG: Rnase Y domain-containing protein, partial [Patescibacteria group bacterium]